MTGNEEEIKDSIRHDLSEFADEAQRLGQMMRYFDGFKISDGDDLLAMSKKINRIL